MQALEAGDVRLTMGGEPTFVAADDPEAPEWNGEAVGPTKADYADKLIRKLRDRFRAGRAAASRPGQVVSGRKPAALGLFALLAKRRHADVEQSRTDRGGSDDPDSDADHEQTVDADDAQALIDGAAAALGLTGDTIQPVYEDPHKWIEREAELPVNVTALDPKIDDPEERQRIVRTFTRGLTSPVGFALPIQRQEPHEQRAQTQQAQPAKGPRWKTEQWTTRRGALFAVPGDSALGYRLPLGSLPHVPKADYPYIHPRVSTDPAEPLADYRRQPPRAAATCARPRRQPNVSHPPNSALNASPGRRATRRSGSSRRSAPRPCAPP